MRKILICLLTAVVLVSCVFMVSCNEKGNSSSSENKVEVKVDGVLIETLPNKLIYLADEEFDFTGGKTKVLFTDGTSKSFDWTKDTCGALSTESFGEHQAFAKLTYESKEYTLSYSASVVEDANTNFTACLDRHNYSTSWEGGKSSSSIEAVIDLGEEKEIFQTAIKPLSICKLAYKIEISSNGEDWREYAVDSGATAKFVFVNSAYAKARYVKLTLLSSSEGAFVISDFKVQGR